MDQTTAAFTLLCGGFLLWLLFRRQGSRKRMFIKRKLGIPDEPVTYNITSEKGGPFVSGRIAKLGLNLFSSIFGKTILAEALFRQANGRIFENVLMEEIPTFFPLVLWKGRKKGNEDKAPLELENLLRVDKSSESDFRFKDIHDYYEGYRSGKFTPSDVAENVIKMIEMSDKMDPKLRAFVEYHPDQIRKAARESTERFAKNKPLSILDGIPVGIKDELNVASHHIRMGTDFLGNTPCEKDSEVVRRLRAIGAIILGITNMHEFGMGTTGVNISKYHGTPRNPYNVNHFTGGSSSGSAAAVASGLCPVAVGTDGGGSVRLPSAFCGVVGLKPTFGRITLWGNPQISCTVGSIGPLAATVRDAAIMYAVMAGPYSEDDLSQRQPAVELREFNKDLKGLVIGIDKCYFQHADPEIVIVCEKAVEYLKSQGADVVTIQIPELEEARVSHVITILSEMRHGLQETFYNHYYEQYFENASLETIIERASVTDFLQAQQQKTRTIKFLKEILEKVDVIVSPVSAVLAPEIKPDYLKHGFSHTKLATSIMRHVFLANFAGLPALAVPVGYSAKGLPISLQIIGAWWQESTVLRVGRIAEEFLPHKAKPQVFFDVLD